MVLLSMRDKTISLFGSVFQWEKACFARKRLCVRVASDPPRASGQCFVVNPLTGGRDVDSEKTGFLTCGYNEAGS